MGCMCRRGAYVASASASELKASEGELDWGKGRGKVEAHAAGAAIDRWDRCRCRSRALRSRARPSHNVTRFVRRGDAWRAEASICRARLSGRQVGRQVGRHLDHTLECMDLWVDEGGRRTERLTWPLRRVEDCTTSSADRLFWHGPTRFLQRRLVLRDRQRTSSHSMRTRSNATLQINSS
jgi:hypothetical protein